MNNPQFIQYPQIRVMYCVKEPNGTEHRGHFQADKGTERSASLERIFASIAQGCSVTLSKGQLDIGRAAGRLSQRYLVLGGKS